MGEQLEKLEVCAHASEESLAPPHPEGRPPTSPPTTNHLPQSCLPTVKSPPEEQHKPEQFKKKPGVMREAELEGVCTQLHSPCLHSLIPSSEAPHCRLNYFPNQHKIPSGARELFFIFFLTRHLHLPWSPPRFAPAPCLAVGRPPACSAPQGA